MAPHGAVLIPLMTTAWPFLEVRVGMWDKTVVVFHGKEVVRYHYRVHICVSILSQTPSHPDSSLSLNTSNPFQLPDCPREEGSDGLKHKKAEKQET